MDIVNTINRTMSSLEIADITGKRHDDVLRAIRNMEPAWKIVTDRNFAVSEYRDASGRKLTMYELTCRKCFNHYDYEN